VSAKIKSCEWLNTFNGDIVECKLTPPQPTKQAKNGKWYCPFHYAIAKNFKPFDK